MGTNEELAETLEQVVDRYTMRATLEALETVCHAKADHLESNWQDEGGARVWKRLAGKIGIATAAAQKERI
jgi:hypothetical protein